MKLGLFPKACLLLKQKVCLWNIIILNHQQMSNNKKIRRNSKISIKRRQDLISLVLNDNYSIVKAANKLKLKPSTAQQILQRYRESGSFYEKIMHKNAQKQACKKNKVQEKQYFHQKQTIFKESPLKDIGKEEPKNSEANTAEKYTILANAASYESFFYNSQPFFYYYVPYQ